MESERTEIDLKLVGSLMDDTYCLVWVNSDESLDGHPEVFRKCLEERSADHLHESFNDSYLDQESEAVHRAMERLKERLAGMGYEPREIGKFFDGNGEAILDEIYSRNDGDGIEKLLRNTRNIPVRVEMHSNHDCVNSHWFESQGGFSYEGSYWGDMIDALNLNPKTVKRMLVSHGEKVRGRFPDRKPRNGKELVSYEHFYREHINSSSPANLLTFMATLDPVELYKSGFNLSKITIPAGNKCGLFSSACGGGSVLEMELLQDLTVDLTRTEYPKYGLEIEDGGRGYSIKQTYGLDSSAYGKSIRINPCRDEKRIC